MLPLVPRLQVARRVLFLACSFGAFSVGGGFAGDGHGFGESGIVVAASVMLLMRQLRSPVGACESDGCA